MWFNEMNIKFHHAWHKSFINDTIVFYFFYDIILSLHISISFWASSISIKKWNMYIKMDWYTNDVEIFHYEGIISTYYLFHFKEKLLLLITIEHNNLKKCGQLSESNVCQHGVGTLSMHLTFTPGYSEIVNRNRTYNPMSLCMYR